jgi:hypothetical protein
MGPGMPTSIRHCLPALLIVAAVAAGCATPAPLVRLYPNTPDVVWVSGRASVTREEGGVRVGIAFEHQDGPNLGLRVEVQNGSGAALDVNPNEFTFTTCGATAIDTCGLTLRVIDPEAVLMALDEQQSRERADAVNSQAALGTLVILSAIGDAATLASGHANVHTGEATLNAATLGQADLAARESHLGSMEVQQSIWSNEALRRNTLFPGSGTGGRVYVPIDLKAQVVWLHVRTGGRTFSFPFQQTVTRLAPTGSAQAHR